MIARVSDEEVYTTFSNAHAARHAVDNLLLWDRSGGGVGGAALPG
jgi:hypothetical protein